MRSQLPWHVRSWQVWTKILRSRYPAALEAASEAERYAVQFQELSWQSVLFAKECVAVAKEKYGGVRCSELKGNIDCNEIICYMAEYAEKLIKDKT